MGGLENDDNSVSTSVMERLRRNAIWCFAGGAGLIVIRIIARIPVISYVAGGIICALGIGWLMAGNKTNRKTGILIVGIGVLQAFSRFPVPHISLAAGIALSIATMWLLVTGVRNTISYLITGGKRYR